MISLVSNGFFDRITRLIKNAVPKSKIAAMPKSEGDQFQPSTKRFAKKAVTINKVGTPKMIVVFCFSKVMIYYLIFKSTLYFKVK